jgi:hypothetical protein
MITSSFDTPNGTFSIHSPEWVEQDFQSAFRWVTRHRADLTKMFGRENVTYQSTAFFDKEGCKVYRIVMEIKSSLGKESDMILVRSMYNHDHSEYGCETCSDRFVYTNA